MSLWPWAAPAEPPHTGPCESPQAAHHGITLLGLTDDTVWATRAIALTPPHTPPSAVADLAAAAMTVVEIPREVVAVIGAYPPVPAAGQAPAVVLAIAGPPHHAVVLGPFPTGEEATRWVGQHNAVDTGPLRRCLVLPLQPLTSDTIEGAAHALPAVVGMTTSTGLVVYGPFPDTLAATYWFHDATSVTAITNPARTVLFRITPPFDATEGAPTLPTAPYLPREGTRQFVAVIHDTTRKLAGSGSFHSHDTACAWWATQQPHFPGVTAEVFAVTEP